MSTNGNNRQSLKDLLDRSLPPDWDDSSSRERQIIAVTQYFVENTDLNAPTYERRKEAQRNVAQNEDIEFNTVQSKCGRETWGDHVDSDSYQREYFDPALEEIEQAWQKQTTNFSELLQRVLSGYPVDQIGKGITQNPIREVVEEEIPEKLDELLEDDELIIEASAGQGRWTSIPWVAIMDPRETTDIQDGIYVVYLFEPQENRVVLTLNQGVTVLKEELEKKEARQRLKERAKITREKIWTGDFSTEPIEFPHASSRNDLYGPATIVHKRYNHDEISDESVEEDLDNLITTYQDHVSRKQNSMSNLNITDETNIIQVPIKQGGPIEENYERTVVNGVPKDSVRHICKIPVDNESVHVWGNQNEEPAETGDYLLFSKRDGRSDGEYTFLARIAQATVLDEEKAKDFTEQIGWGQGSDRIFPHVMFLEPIYRVDLDREMFWDVMDFKGWPNDTYSPIWFGRDGSRFYDIYNSKREFVKEIVTEQIYPTEDNEILTQYWELVQSKSEAGERFLNQPSNENLAAFFEEFWTLRAAPSVDWILSNWLSEYSPEEIADKLNQAVEQEDINIAVELNGFGVSVASECLRALEPTKFPILNGPAYEGMKTLGYDPTEPSNASPEDYLEFAANVADAIDRYDLLQIAEDADSIVTPEWATVLQIVDHLFYEHTNEEHEFTFDEWLPCESTVETAPYYWVNQPAPSDDTTKLEATPDSFDTQVGRLETNDTVFHHDNGEILGYSTVEDKPKTVKADEKLQCRVGATFTRFEESIPFSDVYNLLLEEKKDGSEYFPVDESGVRSGYLYNLSERAGDYILEQTEPDRPKASQVERLRERLLRPEFSVNLPSDLYFHEREESRLKQQINAALNSGKHIIFTGPPGTGKSKLAKHIAEQAADHHDQVDGYVFTTATAEWTTFDTIGGYVPDDSGDSLKFDPRLFLRCFRDDDGDIQNQWLVVDELNRANIDKALGPLFSVLAQDSVQLPFERENRIQIDWVEDYSEDESEILSEIAHDPDRFPVTPSWWLIGTMNTVDKTSLYDLSFAFMRRFSFIHVGIPELTMNIEGEEIVSRDLLDPVSEGQNYSTTWQQGQLDIKKTLDNYHEEISVIWAIVNKYRSIGPAIVLDMLHHLNVHEGGDEKTPLTSAIISLVLPQMEGLREQDQLDLLDDLEKGLPIQDDEDESVAKDVDLRIDFDYLRRKAYDMFDLDPGK